MSEASESRKGLPDRTRRLLISGAAAAGITAAVGVNGYLPAHRIRSTRMAAASPISYQGPWDVNGSRVVGVEVEHTREAWLAHYERLTQLIEEATVVVPGYRREEASNGGKVIADAYSDVNYLYDEVARVSKNRKTMWVVDPYYNDDAMGYRTLIGLPESFIGPTAAIEAWVQFGREIDRTKPGQRGARFNLNRAGFDGGSIPIGGWSHVSKEVSRRAS